MKTSVNNIFTPAVEINENGSIFVTIRKEVPANVDELAYRKIDWTAICEAIYALIEQRAKHCEEQLAMAVAKGETFRTHPDSEIICYKGGGHFSIPVYKAMTDFLASDSVDAVRDKMAFGSRIDRDCLEKSVAKGITQQALRQLFYIIDGKNSYAKEEYGRVNQYYSPIGLSNILTEHIFVL